VYIKQETFFTFQILLIIHLGKSKKDHIKKPLNAFMLYMKEMRPVVQAECTLKESAAINQILGRRVRTVSFYFNFYWFFKKINLLMLALKEKKE
jgi:hypothetical protein